MQRLLNKPRFGARLDLSHPYNKGTVGCWLMNGQGWREPDLSPYGNHGILAGFTDPVYTGGQRTIEGIKLDGVDDYIDCGNQTSLDRCISNAITIEVWIKALTPDGGVGYDRIITKANEIGVSSTNSYILQFNGVTRKVFFGLWISGDNAIKYVIGNTALSINKWYHVVATYDNINIKIYVNGRLDGTTAQSGTMNISTKNVVIGATSTLQAITFFDGTVGITRIYNRALSADEIKQLYINPYAPGGKSLFI